MTILAYIVITGALIGGWVYFCEVLIPRFLRMFSSAWKRFMEWVE
jgi:hypothetical protein